MIHRETKTETNVMKVKVKRQYLNFCNTLVTFTTVHNIEQKIKDLQQKLLFKTGPYDA